MNDNILEPFDDVADSTDWLSTPLSGLAAVEAALRCQVCKDFYKTPMLTSCNHTFCSICIRRALSNDGKCPLCRTSEQEMKLRSNWSMEEVVATFTKTRTSILLFARSQGVVAEPSKRKLEETEDSESGIQPSGKRLRSSTRLSKSRSMEATSEMARLEADIPDQDQSNFEPDDGLVACPICWQRMKAAQVDRHIDMSCPSEPQPQTTPSSQPSRSMSIPVSSPKKLPPRNVDRLPAINYSMIKEQQLRKKLSELGISTAGSRQMLEKRHKEWMTIWNANCDSQYPRQKRELLHDLDSWERTMGARAPVFSKSITTGVQIKDKDFDGAAWSTKHDDSFKGLIANARRNRALAEQKASEGDKCTEATQQTVDVGNGGKEIEEGDAVPQLDVGMPISSLSWEERQGPVGHASASRVIDLTGNGVSPDGGSGTVDLDTSSKPTVLS
ncbi:DNA repair protein rad18 [Annulohypoxylon maeteangense]|uniref:DNA repair protein rad18 n=1 Tax=Annulohypoxylon maeteangense TaxID=1927788 RepID=UPI002007F34E|nr:DNA repair protein rad18 [Annulohypoxylon maeteangense]KAI0889524.1 DNA repair protein rad18 [Annulohypoxylon maeteangense]